VVFGIVLAVGMVMIGMNVIMRRQWTEKERLGYPSSSSRWP